MVHGEGAHEARVASHEEAAHETRNWVRLTYECNNRCVFCLDSDTHDGEMRDPEDVKRQILDGRRKGATRLILSGGEPTIHPRFVDFVRLGKLAGYRRIQTVTNGRLFSYGSFFDRCMEAGLEEITFSIHGPNARVHDALVGVKGAYEEEMAGLRRALADGRPIVNVDVVINRGNVKVLPELLEGLYAEGVREFDLLQVVPFGRAFTEGKDTLFYDLEEAAPSLRHALEFSKRPDVHVWLNRFPPPHLEGFEHLIQDPYKLTDEVRGRREEFSAQLTRGELLDCRDPARCRYCYLERLCDDLEDTQARYHEARFEELFVDTAWESKQPPAYGGDPASARRAQSDREVPADRRVRLPLANGPNAGVSSGRGLLPVHTLPELAARAGARRLSVAAPTIAEALRESARFSGIPEIALTLGSLDGLEEAMRLDADGEHLGDKRLVRVTVRTEADARRLLALDARFEVELWLSTFVAPWLLSLEETPPRLALRQPTYERLTEAQSHDLDAPSFFRMLRITPPVRGLPRCVIGREVGPEPERLDARATDARGAIEIFRFTKRFVLEGYTTKSLRCRGCAHDASCEGMHVNQVRAHGYAWMSPIAQE
ncbi:MAG: radical SAM protein [Sandaracinaceae bacterium]|nr:radical SAM protein [Sandaracinaceae bacterium]